MFLIGAALPLAVSLFVIPPSDSGDVAATVRRVAEPRLN